MRKHFYSIALALLLAVISSVGARATDPVDLKSDTWAATDAIGRKLPGSAECGPLKQGKYVGIFYFLWMGEGGTAGPYDNSKLLAANPNPQWNNDTGAGCWHHWGEPEVGYYVSRNPWVIRRHCQMLVEAGVDVLIIDQTNGWIYSQAITVLFQTLEQIRAEGGKTPQVMFITQGNYQPGNTKPAVEELYDEIYAKNLYSDLWFRWEGKPMILNGQDSSPSLYRAEVQNFFTFRKSWAWTSKRTGYHVNVDWWGKSTDPTRGQDRWAWLDDVPQNFGWHTDKTKPEEISVSIAQHPFEMANIGRSCHDRFIQPNPGQPGPFDTTPNGSYFAEQWAQALTVDPDFIFITGWNEWIAQRQIATDTSHKLLGNPVPVGGTYFVDSYTQEFSRDAEPMKGGHTDSYYYQMVAGIRKFKGVRADEVSSTTHSIDMDGDFNQWAKVNPDYLDAINDTATRDEQGWNNHYTNTTGRNDFAKLKVAQDDTYVCFYAETKDNITQPAASDPYWMMLFVDADNNSSTGWEGYDYMVSGVSDGSMMSLKRSTGGANWEEVAKVPYRLSGNKMMVRIRRADLGLATSGDIAFNFHWADNIQKLGDILEFSLNGDSAPDRRFNYHYQSAIVNAVKHYVNYN